MSQRQGTSWFRITGLAVTGLTAAVLLGAGTVSAGNGHGHGHGNGHGHDDGPGYKGTSTLNLVSVAPNPARCGAFPNMEVVFEGTGMDTAGGIVVSIDSSACQNVATGEVFDLIATDTYANGDSLNIVSDEFTFVLDPQTCITTNIDPVDFSVDGGTGAFAGATGGGSYHIAVNDPSCNGEIVPASVWFEGRVH